MENYKVHTYTYKEVNGLQLTIDVTYPPGHHDNGNKSTKTVLLHLHGGFLVIGEKSTLPPTWLINACHNRGWAYSTPSYRLIPEANGLDVLSDCLDAVTWTASNIASRLILAGSSAAVLSIYGMVDLADERYIHPGRGLRGCDENLAATLGEIESAMGGGDVVDGCPFPSSSPTTARRLGWVSALHEAAWYPDVLTRGQGLAGRIRAEGVAVIPEQWRVLFPLAFGMTGTFPPMAVLHGDADVLVDVKQSERLVRTLENLGVKVVFGKVAGEGHGFDAKEFIDLDNRTSEDDKAFYSPLRRIVAFLESQV